MAIRLIKVAKDLNVAISVLVEHLQKKGIELENSPRTQISVEVYEILLRDFEQSITKTQADQLVIHNRFRIDKEKELKRIGEETPLLKNLKLKGKINLDQFKKTTPKRIERVKRIKEQKSTEQTLMEVKTNIDYTIYKALFQEKKLTEQFIGSIPFKWNYTVAHYTAELTEAVDFTLFDKVICGILQIDEIASLEEIGTILGMNVVDNPNKKQYLDPAEREILVEALQLLESYEMIEVGDSYYSRCRLTSAGKEYAQKGQKFKVTDNVPFKLYFDNSSRQHQTAHRRFSNLTGVRSAIEQDFDLLDETRMREVAVVQTPEIYNPNPETLRSFRRVNLDKQKTQSRSIEVYACFMVDIESNELVIKVYEPQSKIIHKTFSTIINEMQTVKNDLVNQFTERFNFPFPKQKQFINYETLIKNQQKRIDNLLSENELEKAHLIAKEIYSEADIIDSNYFINNLNGFITSDYEEIWLTYSEVDDFTFYQIKNLVANTQLNLTTQLFLIIPPNIEIESDKLNIWISNNADVEENIFFFKKTDNIECLVTTAYPIDVIINSENIIIYKEVLEKTSLNQVLEEVYTDYKELMETTLLDKTQKISNRYDEINTNELSKIDIENYRKSSCIFKPFENTSNTIHLISNFKELQGFQIQKLKNRLIDNLNIQLNDLLEQLKTNEFEKLEKLEPINSELEKIKSNLFNDEADLFKSFRNVEALLIETKQQLRDKLLAKTYIIDTNVFVEEPNILDWIIGKNYAVVSGKVVDELDNLKKNDDLRSKVNRAIRSIKIAQGKKQIRTSIGDKKLLPDDFDGRSADNLILSVALMYKNKEGFNAVLLTSDNAFQVKANMLDIRTIDLKTFLEENPTTETDNLAKKESYSKKEEDNKANNQENSRTPIKKKRKRNRNRKPKN